MGLPPGPPGAIPPPLDYQDPPGPPPGGPAPLEIPPGFPPMAGFPPGFPPPIDSLPPLEGMPPPAPDWLLPGLGPMVEPPMTMGAPGPPELPGLSTAPCAAPELQGAGDIAGATASAVHGAAAKASMPSVPDPLSRLERDPLAQLQARLQGSVVPSAPATKKRKVEGLASNSGIRGGGSVTVYNGYTAVTAAAQTQPAAASSAAPPPQPAAPAAQSAAAVSEALPRQLPEGWEMKKSRSTGKVYYVNEKLGKSQFEPPAGSTVKVVAQKKQRPTLRGRDVQGATSGDKNGVMGLVRATEKKSGRWARWQATSAMLNAPEPDGD